MSDKEASVEQSGADDDQLLDDASSSSHRVHVSNASEFLQSRPEQGTSSVPPNSDTSTTMTSFADRGRQTMFGRPILPIDAKVVMLVKAEKPGDKPRLLKLEPVSNPAKPDFRSAYEAVRKAAQKQSQLLPIKTRKRRIIPPIVQTQAKTPSSSKSNETNTPSQTTRFKKIKTEDSEGDDVASEERRNRPKRAHKAPQRYGDYVEARRPIEDELENDDKESDTGEVSKDDDAIGQDTENTIENKKSKELNTANITDENDEDADYVESDNEGNVEVDVAEENEEEERTDSTSVSVKACKIEEKPAERKRGQGTLQCDRCSRFFANHNSLNAHRFKVHRIVVRASVKCPGCAHRATTIHTLNEHIAEEHGLKLEYVKRKFKNTTEFQNYLDDLAVTQNMGFVRHRKSDNKRQLYCNRSGVIRINKGDAIRNRPRKGSAKIGAMCPAHMFYTECEDGSIEVNGQLAHFGHALDPRFVFPATSAEKVSSRVRRSNAKKLVRSSNRNIPVDLQETEKRAVSEDGSFVNIDAENTAELDAATEAERRAEDEAMEMQYGPVHPNSEEIDIRMKNIDRLCSFLFDNVSEQLYRLNDETMDMVLRALRTTQNSISNLNSMMIQIKEGDPDVVQKFQRRGPRYNQWMQWMPSKPRSQEMAYSPRQRRQMYEADEYDDDTVYYRQMPLRGTEEYDSVYVVDEGQVEAQRVDGEEQYYEQY